MEVSFRKFSESFSVNFFIIRNPAELHALIKKSRVLKKIVVSFHAFRRQKDRILQIYI